VKAHLNADLPPTDTTPNLDVSESDNYQDNTYAFQLEKQLQQKSSEIIRLKKKIATLEKQLDAKKQEQEKH
jgi:flagellar motility protein MotE (MotC chaperone)